ncbi:MAG: type II toxin-antitoxin system RelE/ParE family toxin [bacterium]|nr:type II toxin-antitoxin system RelE/ParE family toxin [bacterium]
MGSEKKENYTIKYFPVVVRTDIPSLDAFWRDTVLRAVTLKLSTHPETYGKPLRESLVGWRTLRVDDYRVAYEIKGKVVHVLGILHRSKVYKEIEKRLGLR